MADAPRAAAGLVAALDALRQAVLSASADAVSAAAANLAAELKMAERSPPPRAVLEQLAELSRDTGSLLALRQASVHWALTRLTGSPGLYDRAGRNPVSPSPRRLASA